MPTLKSDSRPPKVSSPQVSSPRASSPKASSPRTSNSQGSTNRMLDNLLESAGLSRDDGGGSA